MLNKTILIPIETSSRELLYKVYLCNLLSLNGFNCFLGNKVEISNLFSQMNSFLYLDKGYHKDVSEKIYADLKSRNAIIVNLDEEGAIAFPDGSPLHLRYSKKALDSFDFTFFWGSAQMEMVNDIIPEKNKAIVSGHPRFYLLKNKFKFLYEEKVKEIKDKYGRYILINTNFARANNIRGEDIARNNYIGRYKNIDTRIKNDKIKLKIFKSLIEKLSKLDYNIVVRPHPEEKIDTYQDYFKNLSNVFITNSGSVVPWIIGSETLIHSDCTTAVEALMLNKKSISFLDRSLDKSVLTILPQKGSYVFYDEDKVVEFIKNKSFKNNETEEYDWLETYFNFSNDSFEIILDNLNKLKFSNNECKELRSYFIYRRAKSYLNKILNRKDSLNSQKLQDFNFENIKFIQKNISTNITNFRNIRIDKKCPNLFLFKQ